MSNNRKTIEINLDKTVALLRNRLKDRFITSSERQAIEEFISELEAKPEALPENNTTSDPYVAYVTETDLAKAPEEASTTPIISDDSRTSSSVPGAEYIEEKRPRQKTLYLLALVIIALAIGIEFNTFRKDHVFARQGSDQARFQLAATTSKHRAEQRLTRPVNTPATPANALPEAPSTKTTAVDSPPEPDSVFLYRYYVSAARLRHGQNRLSSIAQRFGCNQDELRTYNQNIFSQEGQEYLPRAGYIWIPGDQCSYNARAHLHADYVLSYRVSANEGPIALEVLLRRFGCQKERMVTYFRKETPGINPEAIPPGTRVALPSTLCSALNP